MKLTTLMIVLLSAGAWHVSAQAEETLADLTGGVIPILQDQTDSFLMGGELSSKNLGLTTRSELRYTVRVRNQTGDPILASSLIVVVDKIVELARGRDVTDQLEVLGGDGMTQDGKVFFRIPEGESSELSPYSESPTIAVRIRNPDLLRVAPPTLRVHGIRKSPGRAVEKLRDTLLQKGVLSPEEAASVFDTPQEAKP